MISLTATEFIKNFGRHNREAQHEPIAVTSHGEVTGYYMSPRKYEELQKARKALRQSYTIETLPEPLYEAILHARVDPQYDHLNALLDDEEVAQDSGATTSDFSSMGRETARSLDDH